MPWTVSFNDAAIWPHKGGPGCCAACDATWALDAEFEESKHPRDKAGEFTSGGGNASGTSSHPVVQRAFASLPAKHQKLMGKTDIKIVKTLSIGGAGVCYRGHDKGKFTHNDMQIAQGVTIKGQYVPMRDNQIKHVFLHECGHAIDWANSTKNRKDSPSMRIDQTAMDKDAAALSEADRFRAKYWLNSKAEMWAESYALLQGGELGFGMRAEEAHRKFPATIASVKQELARLEKL